MGCGTSHSAAVAKREQQQGEGGTIPVSGPPRQLSKPDGLVGAAGPVSGQQPLPHPPRRPRAAGAVTPTSRRWRMEHRSGITALRRLVAFGFGGPALVVHNGEGSISPSNVTVMDSTAKEAIRLTLGNCAAGSYAVPLDDLPALLDAAAAAAAATSGESGGEQWGSPASASSPGRGSMSATLAPDVDPGHGRAVAVTMSYWRDAPFFVQDSGGGAALPPPHVPSVSTSRLLAAAKAKDPAVTERVGGQLRLLAQMSHEHLVNVLGVERLPNAFRVVTESIPALAVAKGVPIGDPATLFTVVAHVASGLRYLHSSAICHGMIGVGSVCATADGARYALGGAGYSEAVCVFGAREKLRVVPCLRGSSACFPPELLQAEATAGVEEGKNCAAVAANSSLSSGNGSCIVNCYAGDVWAFGVLVFRLAFGRDPFNAPQDFSPDGDLSDPALVEFVQSVCRCEVVFPTGGAAVDPAIRSVISACLVADPRHRPSMTDLVVEKGLSAPADGSSGNTTGPLKPGDHHSMAGSAASAVGAHAAAGAGPVLFSSGSATSQQVAAIQLMEGSMEGLGAVGQSTMHGLPEAYPWAVFPPLMGGSGGGLAGVGIPAATTPVSCNGIGSASTSPATSRIAHPGGGGGITFAGARSATSLVIAGDAVSAFGPAVAGGGVSVAAGGGEATAVFRCMRCGSEPTRCLFKAVDGSGVLCQHCYDADRDTAYAMMVQNVVTAEKLGVLLGGRTVDALQVPSAAVGGGTVATPRGSVASAQGHSGVSPVKAATFVVSPGASASGRGCVHATMFGAAADVSSSPSVSDGSLSGRQVHLLTAAANAATAASTSPSAGSASAGSKERSPSDLGGKGGGGARAAHPPAAVPPPVAASRHFLWVPAAAMNMHERTLFSMTGNLPDEPLEMSRVASTVHSLLPQPPTPMQASLMLTLMPPSVVPGGRLLQASSPRAPVDLGALVSPVGSTSSTSVEAPLVRDTTQVPTPTVQSGLSTGGTSAGGVLLPPAASQLLHRDDRKKPGVLVLEEGFLEGKGDFIVADMMPSPLSALGPSAVADGAASPLAPAKKRKSLLTCEEAQCGINAHDEIEQVRANGEAALMLHNLNLEALPANLTDPALVGLTMLDLSNNLLEALPESISVLGDLTRLIVGNNRLTRLPESLGDMPSLTYLDVNHNQLTGLPQALMFSESLQTIAMDYNDADAIPEVAFDMPSLRVLFLAENPRITRLPTMEMMQSVAQLQLGLDNVPSMFKAYGELKATGRAGGVEVLWNKIFPDEVVPGLFIGSLRAAESHRAYSTLSITHVLSAGRGLNPLVEQGMKQLTLVVDDIEEAGNTLRRQLEEAAAFIADAIDGPTKGGCLVHCFAGMSRSATVAIAYLMLRRGMRLDTAYKACLHARPAIYPNSGFFKQLRALDDALFPGQRPLDEASMQRDKVPA